MYIVWIVSLRRVLAIEPSGGPCLRASYATHATCDVVHVLTKHQQYYTQVPV